MRTAKPKTARAVMVPGGIGCLSCGEEQLMFFPLRLDVFAGASRAFEKAHRSCKPNERAARRFKFTTPEEWLGSWDVGISSKTILWALLGQIQTVDLTARGLDPWRDFRGPDVPADPSDFARCARLVAVAGWRPRLPEVAKRFPIWAPYVDRWDELQALHDEEFPSGSAPKLFALLEEIRATAEKGPSA